MEKIRIFVASPGDVKNERARIKGIVESLNNGLAGHLDIVLEVKDWSQVLPDMGRGQGVIFDQIQVETWDVLIGILWLRYGSPSGGANPLESGTHEEFRIAYESWKNFGRPRIMFYRCTRSPEDITTINMDDLGRINLFFKEFEIGGKNQGLYKTYDTPEVFERLVREHLESLLISYSKLEKKRVVADDVFEQFKPKIPNNLPRRVAFFGRETEMEKVLGALSINERGWGVVIDGIGGIGKTALAVEAAYRTKEAGLFNAFVFVTAKKNLLDIDGIRNLEPSITTVDTFLNETARIINQPGITQLVGNEKKRALIEALQSLNILLIYDNLETLTDYEQKELADFLRFLPQSCKSIITSRRRGGEGALWLRLEKIDWLVARKIIEDESSKSLELSTKLDTVGEKGWRELYDETKGSPLALVHILGILRTRKSLSFDGCIEILKGNQNEDLLAFVFEEARKELGKNELVILYLLSLFAAPASFEALLGVTELSRSTLEMSISRLDALSIINILEDESYSLHPLTRAYISKELWIDVDMRLNFGYMFSKYWLDYSARYGGESYKTYHQLGKEWENIQIAYEHLYKLFELNQNDALRREIAMMASDFKNCLSRFLIFSGHWDEGILYNEKLYLMLSKIDSYKMAGWHAYDLMEIFSLRGDDENYKKWRNNCNKSWELEGGMLEKGASLQLAGQMSIANLRYDDAKKLFSEALLIFRELAAESWIRGVTMDLVLIERGSDDYKAIEKAYQKNLASAARFNDKETIVDCMLNLAEIALEYKKTTDADVWLEKLQSLIEELGRRDFNARYKYALAIYSKNIGRADLALNFAQESLQIYEQLRHKDAKMAQAFIKKLKKRISKMSHLENK